MERLTAVTTLVAQHGVRQVVSALSGSPAVGDLVAQLFGALLASEDRLSDQLAALERRLEEVLEQPYSIAVRGGLRALVDAGTAAPDLARQHELQRARDLFTQAVGAARSPLQTALAERYLLLCALALGRNDTAGNALDRLNAAAFEAALASAQRYTGNEPRGRRPSRQGAQDIRDAADDATRIAVQLLIKAGVLGESLGRAAPSQITGPTVPRSLGFTTWSLQPAAGARTLRFGPLHIEWTHVTRSTQAPRTLFLAPPGQVPGGTGPQPDGGRSPAAEVLDVSVTVTTDSALAVPLTLELASPPQWRTLPLRARGPGGRWTMEPGTPRLTFFCRSEPPANPFWSQGLGQARLIVGRVFLFHSTPAQQPAPNSRRR